MLQVYLTIVSKSKSTGMECNFTYSEFFDGFSQAMLNLHQLEDVQVFYGEKHIVNIKGAA